MINKDIILKQILDKSENNQIHLLRLYPILDNILKDIQYLNKNIKFKYKYKSKEYDVINIDFIKNTLELMINYKDGITDTQTIFNYNNELLVQCYECD